MDLGIRNQRGNKLWDVLLEIYYDFERFRTNVPKLFGMQEAYLAKNQHLYTEAEIETIRAKLEAVVDKFQMASFWLEQLWALSDASRGQSFVTGSELHLGGKQLFILRCYLDAFLFEARSYLDLFMFYILMVLKPPQLDPKMHMRSSSFLKALDRVKDKPFSEKANKIKVLFQHSDADWISLLRELRDRIAHRDILLTNLESREKISTLNGDTVTFNWPTVRQRTYDRLCQDFENGIFFLILEVFPILFDLEWQPGPYRPGMFGEPPSSVEY